MLYLHLCISLFAEDRNCIDRLQIRYHTCQLSATPSSKPCFKLDLKAGFKLQFYTHTRARARTFNGPFSGTTQVSSYQKGKPIWILLKQETVSGSGISWTICKSAPRSRQITTPALHQSFLQTGCPSCHPTNSVKALKASFQFYT